MASHKNNKLYNYYQLYLNIKKIIDSTQVFGS